MATITPLRTVRLDDPGTVVADLPTRLDIHELTDLAVAIEATRPSCAREVSLDGSLVEHTDAAALDFLVATRAAFAAEGTELTITNASLALTVIYELAGIGGLPRLRSDDLLIEWEAA